MRKEVFLLFGRRRANIDGVGEPIGLATVPVSLLEVFEVLAHPGLVATAEVNERRVAFFEVLTMIVHERVSAAPVQPRDHFQMLFKEVLLNGSYQAAILIFTNEINLLELRVTVDSSLRRRIELFYNACLQIFDACL